MSGRTNSFLNICMHRTEEMRTKVSGKGQHDEKKKRRRDGALRQHRKDANVLQKKTASKRRGKALRDFFLPSRSREREKRRNDSTPREAKSRGRTRLFCLLVNKKSPDEKTRGTSQCSTEGTDEKKERRTERNEEERSRAERATRKRGRQMRCSCRAIRKEKETDRKEEGDAST